MKKAFLSLLISGALASSLLCGCGADETTILNPSVMEGVDYIKMQEDIDPALIQDAIREVQMIRENNSVEHKLEQFESGELDLWSQFSTSIVLGDSRTQGFYYHNYLSMDRVYAGKGDSVKQASDHLAEIAAKSPTYIFFTYGINDTLNTDFPTPEDYVYVYKNILRSYQDALPDTVIFVSSIIPPTAASIAARPPLGRYADFNTLLESMCAQEGFVYVNCDQLAVDHPELIGDDGIHFYPAMYPLWAEYLISGVLHYVAE